MRGFIIVWAVLVVGVLIFFGFGVAMVAAVQSDTRPCVAAARQPTPAQDVAA